MTRTRKDADRDVLHIKKGGKVNLEFCWDNFKKEKYTDIKDKLDKRAKLADDYIGSVRVGEICVDVLIRDYGEGDTPKYVLLVLGNAIVAHIKLAQIVMWKLGNGFNQKRNDLEEKRMNNE